MQRIVLTLTLIGAGLATLETTQGGEFWDRVHLDRARMNCWPEPFVHDDRNLVRRPLAAMTNRGWQLQNTLSDHFFNDADQSLTRAGQFKLRWILTQAPAHRRTVYVLRSMDSYDTSERLAAVREYVSGIPQDEQQTEVLVSNRAPAGGSGDYFDQVDRQLKASIPAPRLPDRTGIVGAGG